MTTRTRTPQTAVDRLKHRIAARIDADRERPRDVRLSQVGLADKIGIAKSTLSELLSGPSARQGLLAHLDVIADYLGIPAAELIAPSSSHLTELRRDEQRLIRQWRAWPTDVRARLLSVFEFFGELWPEDVDQRNWLHDLQRVRPEQRRALRNALDAMIVDRQRTSKSQER